MSALKTAALSGIDVRIMMPRKGDSLFIELASRTYLQDVLDAGIKVYFYTKGFNHSKLLVCDDCLSTCGSTNIDFRSFEENFESNIFFYDNSTAMRLKRVFIADQQYCDLIDDASLITNRPFLSRLLESIIRMLSPLL
jgi:cardiolipin synthase